MTPVALQQPIGYASLECRPPNTGLVWPGQRGHRMACVPPSLGTFTYCGDVVKATTDSRLLFVSRP
ncbi:hypothetical protein EDD30_4363 [Couchioplanes caeruleus]|uniref:Uncharacterized protein n=1 Tax=Couchioplanes caeruleus TaxID=56438 RepID=A0A3N1GMH2_9ACTN|nr:hypothetical protein EDD30_4363 [Couchioplanes caeruleus]